MSTESNTRLSSPAPVGCHLSGLSSAWPCWIPRRGLARMPWVIEKMTGYGIEFNDKIESFKCPHCGEESKTVWGWVSKDNAAYAVYFANLMTGHQEMSARLTISIGGW